MQAKKLRERWHGLDADLTGPSPFGATDEGYEDFRGITIDWPKHRLRPTLQINRSQLDLSFGSFDEVTLMDCVFNECRFVRAKIEDIYAVNCAFVRCDFSGASNRTSGNSMFVEGSFDSCVFEGAQLQKVDFKATHFLNIKLNGKSFGGNQFVETRLERCLFSGRFFDCRFDAFNSSREPSEMNDQNRGYVVDCDLRDASFSYCDFIGGIRFERVNLPADGSMIVIENSEIIKIKKRIELEPNSSNRKTLLDCLEIFGKSKALEGVVGCQIVFRPSLVEYCGDQLGNELFEEMQSRAVPWNGRSAITAGELRNFS